MSVARETQGLIDPEDALSIAFEDSDAAIVRLRPASAIARRGADPVPGPLASMPLNATLWNLRMPTTIFTNPLDQIRFTFPAAAFDRWADDVGLRRFGTLRYSQGATVNDDVIARFALSLLQSLEGPATSSLFVDYALFAVCTYLARTFGNAQPRESARGGLAPWQERRAKDLIEDGIRKGIALQDLADACHLSVSHFVRAFRESTGFTPHRWLLDRRVDRATGLLSKADNSLLDVSNLCGFADQSHFTRTFVKHVGVTPGRWRRGDADRVGRSPS